MSYKYFFTKCFLPASFVFLAFPSRSHLASLRNSQNNFQDIVGNDLSQTAHPDVEIIKDIPEDSPKSQSIRPLVTLQHLVPLRRKVNNLEPGFNLTKEEMEKFKIWPYGIIPYYIDDYSFDTVLCERIRTLLSAVNTVTGLRFMELSNPAKEEFKRWVLFINRRGVLSCEDYTTSSFTDSGVQKVVLGYDCLGAGGGALAGTVLALAGVPPQHNAPNRDDYINIDMDNIIPEKKELFKVLRDDEWLFHDISYDFLSAGHYDFYKYTVNGRATILPKQAVAFSVEEGDGISNKDILKIKMLYNYIKRKSPKAKASDCSQLFRPGANFDDFNPLNQDDDMKPRQKPNKYLKLSDKSVPEITDSNKKLRGIKTKEHNRLKNNKKGHGTLANLPDRDTSLER